MGLGVSRRIGGLKLWLLNDFAGGDAAGEAFGNAGVEADAAPRFCKIAPLISKVAILRLNLMGPNA